MRLLAAFLLFAGVGLAQQTSTTPDCQFSVVLTAATRSAAIPALSSPTGTPCVSWRVSYHADNMSAISLSFQGTNDLNGAPNGAGWITLGGACPGTNPCTIVTGTNPLTDAAQSELAVTGYFPWISVNAGTYTSSGSPNFIAVKGYGYKGALPQPPSAGGAASNVNIQQVGGVAVTSDGAGGQVPGGTSIALTDAVSNTQTVFEADNAATPTVGANRNFAMRFNGATWDREKGCTTAAPAFVNLAGSGNTQIFAGTAAQNIYICDMEFSTGTPEDFKLTEGTGSNCGSGTADSTALMKNISAWSLTPAGGIGAARITATAGDSLCANQAGTQAAAVTIWAIKF
jgi:hypothetical protein